MRRKAILSYGEFSLKATVTSTCRMPSRLWKRFINCSQTIRRVRCFSARFMLNWVARRRPGAFLPKANNSPPARARQRRPRIFGKCCKDCERSRGRGRPRSNKFTPIPTWSHGDPAVDSTLTPEFIRVGGVRGNGFSGLNGWDGSRFSRRGLHRRTTRRLDRSR